MDVKSHQGRVGLKVTEKIYVRHEKTDLVI